MSRSGERRRRKGNRDDKTNNTEFSKNYKANHKEWRQFYLDAYHWECELLQNCGNGRNGSDKKHIEGLYARLSMSSMFDLMSWF